MRQGRRFATVLAGAALLLGAAGGAAWADPTPSPAPPVPGAVTAPAPAVPLPAPIALPDLAAALGGSTIHPGVQVRTDGAQCTSNFVFTGGGKTFLGQAAHCSGTGGSTETDGCTSESLPLGTPVEISGASKPGKLAYNSWLAMQESGESDADACAYNDLALVEIDPADVAAVSPTVPFFGGPTGLDTDGLGAGERVASYGNSELRGGVAALSPKVGVGLGDQGNGWSHPVLTVTPGVPGDSGSGFLSPDGTAVGVLSTLNLLPAPGSNGVGDLARMLDYARDHGAPGDLALATGGPFRSLGLL
ncbi:serine protease [Actinomycetospora termitidis]|uniref:Serine protease n=1 Tax=Actinomycetospora termitidis TaxID=3053470 RepID=A0ABT7M3M7_9PSEU|nr:serine protease [Actinomycetospora sp. Odt1-22]MDL5155255.1 serine protease [Actinomycetospora sp. Odt1-22]